MTSNAFAPEPYDVATPITKDDADLYKPFRAFMIGGGSILSGLDAQGTAVAFTGLVPGVIYPISLTRFDSTTTDATGIIGLR